MVRVRHIAIPREPVVWIIDAEQWPRACLRAELIERGFDVYGFIAPADAFQSLSARRTPRPEAIILEMRGQHFTDATFEAIRELKVPTILLAGSLELTDARFTNLNWAAVVKRPVSLGEIADLIQERTKF